MKIVIKENTWLNSGNVMPGLKMEFGWGNGYALIPRGHKFHGVHYTTVDDSVNVHGGLTFSTLINVRAMKFYGLSKRHLGKWMVGFDTCHYRDTPQSCPREYVIKEARFLAEQLKNLNK